MNLIEIKNLNFAYKNKPVLENISLNIEKSDYTGILGPNGGGKTTLLKLILGLLRPDGGEINRNQNLKIGYVPQKIETVSTEFPITVEEILLTVSNSDNKLTEMMKLTEIEALKKNLFGELSGGQRQRVLIARSLINNPDILILDEPTVGVDIISQTKFYNFLKDLNRNYKITIVLVSHDIGVISKQVDKIYFVNKTITCFHNHQNALSQANLQKLYGEGVDVINHTH